MFTAPDAWHQLPDDGHETTKAAGVVQGNSSPKESKFGPLHPLPDPKPHPIRSDELIYRFTRASMLARLSRDYASQAQSMVKEHLELEDPYRGNSAVALLVITAVRESLRAAKGVIKTSAMDEFFAQSIGEEIGRFEADHPHVKQARDVIAHVDEYISSNGRDTDQWFDTTNRFDENLWIFRIGNKLDIDMVKLVSEIVSLADFVYQIWNLWFEIERKMDGPSELLEALMEIGIYANARVIDGIAEVTFNKVERPNDHDQSN